MLLLLLHTSFSMAQEMKSDVMENIQVRVQRIEFKVQILNDARYVQDYLATQAQLQLMEDTTHSKTLRSRDGECRGEIPMYTSKELLHMYMYPQCTSN